MGETSKLPQSKEISKSPTKPLETVKQLLLLQLPQLQQQVVQLAPQQTVQLLLLRLLQLHQKCSVTRVAFLSTFPSFGLCRPCFPDFSISVQFSVTTFVSHLRLSALHAG